MKSPRRQHGVALVMVLWILLLVTISTSAYTLMARMDQLEAHTILSGTRARLAAEAGMNLALLSLRDPDETARLVPDGRPNEIRYQDTVVEVQVTDEGGILPLRLARRFRHATGFLFGRVHPSRCRPWILGHGVSSDARWGSSSLATPYPDMRRECRVLLAQVVAYIRRHEPAA